MAVRERDKTISFQECSLKTEYRN